MDTRLRDPWLLLVAAALGCGAPPAPSPDGARAAPAAATSEALLDRALREYDAAALKQLMHDPAPRVAVLAAHGLGEILRLEASVAEERGDDARLEALTARRLEVARLGLERIEAALALAPDDPALLVARGELRAYLIDGFRAGLVHGRAARRDLEAALARDPANPDARLAWAKQYYYLPGHVGGDLDRARRELEAIVARSPDHEPSWGFLGQVCLAQGREAEARAALEQALRLNPRSLRARAWLLGQEDLE